MGYSKYIMLLDLFLLNWSNFKSSMIFVFRSLFNEFLDALLFETFYARIRSERKNKGE